MATVTEPVRAELIERLQKLVETFTRLLPQQYWLPTRAHVEGLRNDVRDAIAVLSDTADALAAARAEGKAEGMREAAGIAKGKVGFGVPCPYGRDKPGDPTWSHTDDDACPVCLKNGHDSLYACHDNIGPNIATAILAAIPAPADNG